MVSNELLETMCETLVDELHNLGIRSADWRRTTASHRDGYRKAMRETLRAVGVKVEGEVEVKDDVAF